MVETIWTLNLMNQPINQINFMYIPPMLIHKFTPCSKSFIYPNDVTQNYSLFKFMMIDKTNYTVCRLKIIFSYVSLIKIKLKQVFKPTNNKRIIAHVTSLPNMQYTYAPRCLFRRDMEGPKNSLKPYQDLLIKIK